MKALNLVLSLLLTLPSLDSSGLFASIQSNVSTVLSLNKLEEPPDRGAPTGREPLGTRGSCQVSDRPFTPLLPLPNPEFSGYTLTGHPTFWFYVPYADRSERSGQFQLKHRDGSLLYEAVFTLPPTPGFVRVSVPAITAALNFNQPYRWSLILDCAAENDEPSIVRHRGQITRISRSALVAQLATSTPLERIRLYRENQLWYDAAADLDKLSLGSESWNLLFQSLDLEDLEQEAIAGAVIIQQ
jgi:hypothetical protein